MNRCWFKGAIGDALHAVLCAAGYNSRWLLRAIVRLGIKPVFLRLLIRWLQSARSAPWLRFLVHCEPSTLPLLIPVAPR